MLTVIEKSDQLKGDNLIKTNKTDNFVRLIVLILGTTGPLFDEDGQVLTHTILGSWEDFQQEAIKRGDIEVCH